MPDLNRAFKNLLNPDTQYTEKPVSSQVQSVNTENDLMVVDAGSSGTPTVGIPHPYIGPNSWFRFYPEAGSPVLVQQRAEDHSMVSLGYYRDSSSTATREATDAEIPTFTRRKMYIGEFELSSLKQGQVYGDRRGNLEFRSGLMNMGINQDRLEIGAYTGTHIRKVSGSTVATGASLADQERFGLIKRSPVNPAFEAYFGGPESTSPTTPFQFVGSPVYGKEYVRNISTRPTSGAPSVIPVVDYREGTTVVTDQGIPDITPIATIPPTKGPYRMRARWFTLPNASISTVGAFTSLDIGMDLSGNLGIALPDAGNLRLSVAGSQGGKIDVVAGNSWSFLIGTQGYKLTTSGSMTENCQYKEVNTPGGALPIARVGDSVSIDLAILATFIAPYLHDSNLAPLTPAPPPNPEGLVCGTIATGNASHLG